MLNKFHLSQVMELLVHVNKRLKSRTKVQLPVEDFLTHYQNTDSSPIVTVSHSYAISEFSLTGS